MNMNRWIDMSHKDRRPKITRSNFERVLEIMQQWFVEENNALARAIILMEQQLHMTRSAYSATTHHLEVWRLRCTAMEDVLAQIFAFYPELDHEFTPTLNSNLERIHEIQEVERHFPPNQLVDLTEESVE